MVSSSIRGLAFQPQNEIPIQFNLQKETIEMYSVTYLGGWLDE